jgi:Zn-dependent protease with chaperone function
MAVATSIRSERSGVAAAAAARLSLAGAVLGTLGLAASLGAVVSLLETWHVGATASVHHVSVLGLTLAYPATNLAGLVVVPLGAVGLAATGLATFGAAREALAAARFARRLAREDPVPFGDALLIEDDRPLAFCAGLLRPRVYVSTGAVALLDDGALDAVLWHERHHARRRDPLRMAAGRVLARSLFFMPGLAELGHRHQMLTELGADESAIAAGPASRSALASAMLAFSGSGAVGFDAVRVDHVLGDPPNWRFPVLLCLVAATAVALLLALALLTARVASGSATLAPPFLSRQPCVIVLAMIAVALALTGWRVRRRLAWRA